MTFRDRLVSAWYAPSPTALAVALAPLGVLFAGAASLRRALYRMRVLPAARLPVPVVVVGNVTAGGTGKTPLVAALARALAQRGFAPGIVSRGYGRRADRQPMVVTAASDATRAGDEPLILARAGWPVAVAAGRAAAARALLAAHRECDVVLCDDGLQHYALARDVEIAVVDGARGLGNGWPLPCGPLREPASRLASVDAVVVQNGTRAVAQQHGVPTFAMTLEPKALRGVADRSASRPLAWLAGRRVHAVAGIGNPNRFFDALAALGAGVERHPFPDHHRFAASDLDFADAAPIVMTEKDAVKCEAFADGRCWYVPIEATFEPALVDRVVEKLEWTRSCLKSSSVRSPRGRSSTTASDRS